MSQPKLREALLSRERLDSVPLDMINAGYQFKYYQDLARQNGVIIPEDANLGRFGGAYTDDNPKQIINLIYTLLNESCLAMPDSPSGKKCGHVIIDFYDRKEIPLSDWWPGWELELGLFHTGNVTAEITVHNKKTEVTEKLVSLGLIDPFVDNVEDLVEFKVYTIDSLAEDQLSAISGMIVSEFS